MAITSEFNHAGQSVFSVFAAQWNELKDALAKRAVYRTTYNELSVLSNRELADLGLSRANLRAVAYDAAYSTH